jgi:multidrug efflux pump subunit AcrA (membrane-fusion protein)
MLGNFKDFIIQNSKVSVLTASIFILLVAVFALNFFLNSSNEHVAVTRGTVIEAIYGLGTVHSERTYQMKIGITSLIRKIYVKEGEHVSYNTPLIGLDSLPVFKAPFSGTITSIPMEVGEIAYPQSTILKMEDFSKVYLSVSLEQQGALRVKKSQKAAINFESLRGIKFDGIVTAIFPSDGQFIVHITVDNLPEEILPGMTADVAIETGKKEDVLLIPVNLVSAGKVIRIRDGKKEKISIKLGVLNGEMAEVAEGDLHFGDKILAPRR